MPTTRMMAAIAAATHITTVRRNNPIDTAGVITIGNALAAVKRTTASPISAARLNPMTALISAWLVMTL